MFLAQKAVTSLTVLALLILQVSRAAVYKVGDSAGWTTVGSVNYRQWAATKSFRVGDIIIFQYNPQVHNVMRVTHVMYKSCNTTAPMATYTTGNDSIPLTTQGHHFFFCGVPGHCQAGQKVDINVPRNPAVTPSPAASDTPSVPATRVHGPSPTNAAPSSHFMGALGSLGLAGPIAGYILIFA